MDEPSPRKHCRQQAEVQVIQRSFVNYPQDPPIASGQNAQVTQSKLPNLIRAYPTEGKNRLLVARSGGRNLHKDDA